MTNWIDHRWYGPVDLVEAARAALPDDAAIIGALSPPLDTPLRVLDGDAAISFAASVVFSVPVGLKNDKPQLLTVLHGAIL